MIKTEATLRAWGNSIGVVLPKDELRPEHFDVGDKVEITIKRKDNPLREAFGKLKFKTPTDKLLKQADEALWGKY
ncbi:hypothetical protein COV19_06930 [Candidatus Woesearchaeota archaeon CG10_big_fil_rev_8_21_14_0_10_44_13]|nr:MAG: hypothetical protein COV19_06930 [Candidatus Woesearchaeota archaeon CG10_big_fil_rev_8_21_14_0_10_44_13]